MNQRHHVKISTDRGRATIHVDGHDISPATHRVVFDFDADSRVPELTVGLLMLTGEVDGREVVVQLPEETMAALVALGWTPPPEVEP